MVAIHRPGWRQPRDDHIRRIGAAAAAAEKVWFHGGACGGHREISRAVVVTGVSRTVVGPASAGPGAFHVDELSRPDQVGAQEPSQGTSGIWSIGLARLHPPQLDYERRTS